MRIRTIKPSFWRSDDITALPMDVRMLFVGLWSYVDDNGVGLDDYRQITADLFALEEDQAGFRQFVRDGLAILSRRLLVVRYKIDDKSLIFVTNWDRHQKVDRPAKPRFPRPPTDFDPSTRGNHNGPDHLAKVPRDIATVSPRARVAGTGEEGKRGTGEKISCDAAKNLTPDRAPAFAPAHEPADPPTPRPGPAITGPHSGGAYRIVDRAIGLNHPSAVRTDLAIQVTGLLRDEISEDLITAALKLWLVKPTLGPRTLPSLVSEVIRTRDAIVNPPAQSPPRPSTTDQRVAAVLALRDEMCGGDAASVNLFALPGGAA